MILYSGKKFTFEAFFDTGASFGSIALPLCVNYWLGQYTSKQLDGRIIKNNKHYTFTLYFLCFGISMEYWGDKE